MGTWECVGLTVEGSFAHLEPPSSFPLLHLFLFLLPLPSLSLTLSWDSYVGQEVAKRTRIRCWLSRKAKTTSYCIWQSFKLRPFFNCNFDFDCSTFCSSSKEWCNYAFTLRDSKWLVLLYHHFASELPFFSFHIENPCRFWNSLNEDFKLHSHNIWMSC